MPYCPNCKAEYVEGIKECYDCQVPLVETLAVENIEAHTCFHCDSELGAVRDFCPRCGFCLQEGIPLPDRPKEETFGRCKFCGRMLGEGDLRENGIYAACLKHEYIRITEDYAEIYRTDISNLAEALMIQSALLAEGFNAQLHDPSPMDETIYVHAGPRFYVILIPVGEFCRAIPIMEQLLADPTASASSAPAETCVCSECNAVVPLSASFCPNCGANFEENLPCPHHPKKEVLARCVICHRFLCSTDLLKNGVHSVCAEHESVEIVEDHALLARTNDKIEADVILAGLLASGFSPFVIEPGPVDVRWVNSLSAEAYEILIPLDQAYLAMPMVKNLLAEIPPLEMSEPFLCSECSAQVPADSHFCPSCGASFQENLHCPYHAKNKVLARCVICHRFLCSTDLLKNGIHAVCAEHERVEMREGYAILHETNDKIMIDALQSELLGDGIKSLVFESTHWEDALIRFADIHTWRILVPFNEFLQAVRVAEKIVRK